MARRPKQLDLFPKKTKGGRVTKGGKPVKLPAGKTKHVQVLKGLINKIINQKAWPIETNNGEKLPWADEKQLVMTIASLNYDPADDIMRQLIAEDFLICRSKATEEELATFYMCMTKTLGQLVKKQSA